MNVTDIVLQRRKIQVTSVHINERTGVLSQQFHNEIYDTMRMTVEMKRLFTHYKAFQEK